MNFCRDNGKDALIATDFYTLRKGKDVEFRVQGVKKLSTRTLQFAPLQSHCPWKNCFTARIFCLQATPWLWTTLDKSAISNHRWYTLQWQRLRLDLLPLIQFTESFLRKGVSTIVGLESQLKHEISHADPDLAVISLKNWTVWWVFECKLRRYYY